MGSCGTASSKKEWTEEEREVFRNSCVAKSKEELKEISAPYCDCMQKKVENKYNDPDKVGELSMGTTMDWAKECLKGLTLPADTLQLPGPADTTVFK